MLMGEIFTNSIKMERELVYCIDNLCRKLTSRSFQFVVSVPLGTDFLALATGWQNLDLLHGSECCFFSRLVLLVGLEMAALK